MTNLIYCAFVAILFFTFSIGAINFSGVNRTFLSMYRGLIEPSIASVDEGENDIPYFSEPVLESYVIDFLDDNLYRYVDEYTVGFFYFNLEDGSMCTDSRCRGVKISLKCDINAMFHYEKAKDYYIKGGVLDNE